MADGGASQRSREAFNRLVSEGSNRAANPVGGLLGGRAAYTWGDWARALGWSGFGSLIGGIGLVTSLRLLQAPHRVAEERADQS
jgi:hypothetical protein